MPKTKAPELRNNEQFFRFSLHEDGRLIVLDGKALAYLEPDFDEQFGYVLASSQDVREMLEKIAFYLQRFPRLKGCKKGGRTRTASLRPPRPDNVLVVPCTAPPFAGWR